ncbi:glycoside hydrolase family 16 protein [Backusella circina FSU 941]|nr:glycoside hydrolase family 16 protein [Backusella circina FSU 941]KAI8877317.1 glycoside hydrolase family 16 protein [Backusella circina FSU 941]
MKECYVLDLVQKGIYTHFYIYISYFTLFTFSFSKHIIRQDFLYGSFRTFMRITPTAGTVSGMFMYHPEGEIDIELLSYLKPSQAYFAIHPGITENGRASNRTHNKHKLEFDASQEFHEYRFDWYPDLAVFYIDGVESYRTTTNILSKPGRFMYNHWTDGNEKFSKGPPTTNAYLHIKNMTFFFNYSDTNNENGISRPKCQNTQASCNITGKYIYI